ncbi:MAG: efflux transporter outer membrane subunit [Sphingomonadales bacterium]|nr:efflux transporter outer membrane subunit [Sphingomonadales bacterium]
MSGPARVRATAAACLLALGGCAVGPDYHLPATAAVNRPAAQAPLAAPAGLASGDALPPRWWRLYADPVLDRLEEQALAGNTDLRIAAANLARAEALTRIAEGAAEPEIAVDAAAERARLSGESFLLPESLPAATLGTATLGVHYQLDLFGRVRRSVEAARADADSRVALVEAVKVTLAGEVARAYAGVCGAQETVDTLEAAAAVRRDLLMATSRLQAAGRVGGIEVTIARARLDEAEAMVPPARARARARLYQLAFLLGRTPAEYPREAEACRHLPTLERALPVGDGAALLARRPDVRAAERELAAATARIGLATADLYPRISFGLSAGSTGFLRDLGTAPANRWGLGSLLQWSFPDAGARGRIAAANAEARRALAAFDGTVLTALRETQTTLATYGEDTARLTALHRATQSAKLGADQVARLRKAGRAAAPADLAGRAEALAAELREQAGQEAVVADQIALFVALGGGW